MKKFLLTLCAVCLLGVSMTACNPKSNAAPPVKQSEARKAEAAASSINFRAGNAEIDNIKKRLELTSDPGLMGYIVLLNESGQPIIYETVLGKVTSGSKRLTKPYAYVTGTQSNFKKTMLVPAPSDEGTHGSSNPYIYYWTTDGKYRQWSGDYLYSDKPFRLRIKPLVIGVTDEKVGKAQ
jgi:hypothetical protein